MNPTRVDANASLAGCHVLVTRPATQADALVEKLSAAGATVTRAPLMSVEPVALSAAARAVIQDLDRFDIVIVTSRHAAQFGVDALVETWPQWPLSQTWLAVGPGTANALREQGIDAQFPEDARSEGLLELPVLRAVQSRRVLLLSGEGGRELLESTLRERGAAVTKLPVYRRVANPGCESALAAFRAEIESTSPARATYCALVTSAEAVQNLQAMAPWMPSMPVQVIVAGARIADVARACGFTKVVVAQAAGDDAMLSALVEEYSRSNHA